MKAAAGIKIPTTDEGLGTGEYDFSTYLSVSRQFEEVLVIGRIGRVFLGDSETVEYTDSGYGALGFGHRFATDEVWRGIDVRIWLRGQTATTSASDDPAEYNPSRNLSLSLEGSLGITDGAADEAIGLGTRFQF